jgi:D-arabinono-1,4-lactone oxidase
MNCLYSQWVNEWAIPMEKGPEALQRLSDWLHGDRDKSRIPFDPRGVWVHAPVEVRLAEASERPYLANTLDRRALLLNATLYRPYHLDPPCRARYYEAFEWLMKELDGRPHWAKNFAHVTGEEIYRMYPGMDSWLQVRREVDPDGMFLGDWHRRYLLARDGREQPYPLEERKVAEKPMRSGGTLWQGEGPRRLLSPQNSEESFDLMQTAETKASVMNLSESSSSEQFAE